MADVLSPGRRTKHCAFGTWSQAAANAFWTGMATKSAVALSADEQLALSGSADGTLRLWDLESGHCECVLGDSTGTVTTVALSHDGRHAISGYWRGAVRVWDLESGRCERAIGEDWKTILEMEMVAL